MFDHNDRFGAPVQRIVDAVQAHRGIIRDSCYVPARYEVATWPADRLWWHLLGWWHDKRGEVDSDGRTGCGRCPYSPAARGRSEIQQVIAQAPPPQSGEVE